MWAQAGAESRHRSGAWHLSEPQRQSESRHQLEVQSGVHHSEADVQLAAGSWQLAAGNWHQSEAEHQSAVPIHFSKVVAVVAVLDVEEDVVEGQNLETEEDLARLE